MEKINSVQEDRRIRKKKLSFSSKIDNKIDSNPPFWSAATKDKRKSDSALSATSSPSARQPKRMSGYDAIRKKRTSKTRSLFGEMFFDDLIADSVGYVIESRYDEIEYDLSIKMMDLEMCYVELFYENEHWNFVGKNGAYILSIRLVEYPYFILLLRKPSGDLFMKVELEQYYPRMKPKEMIKLFSKYSLDLNMISKSLYLHSAEAAELFRNYENILYPKGYKFGLLYSKDGQMDENEMYSNRLEDASEDYLEFLEFVGRKVKLQTWEGYLGGLDKDLDGEYGLFNLRDKRSVVFHVSTFIPYTLNDEQQIARKRHLGNDVVVLVFKEGNTPFYPNNIASRFNHAFIVVQKNQEKSETTGNTFYNVSTTSKEGCGACSPHIPYSGLFEKSPEFHDWLLTKCINTELAATSGSEGFTIPAERTRDSNLKEIFSIATQNKYL